MNILLALDILRSAPDDALKCHAAETISTLKEVGERLQANLLSNTPWDSAFEGQAPPFDLSVASTHSPSSALSAESSYSHEHSTAREPSSRESCTRALEKARFAVCDVSAPDPSLTAHIPKKGSREKKSGDVVAKLDRAIKRTTPWIWETSNKKLECVISHKRKQGEDRRFEDIRRVEGDPKSSETYKLLRLLAIRSLASEFTTEQSYDKSETKVDKLVAYVLSIEAGNDEDELDTKGRRSDVSEFVERHPQISTAPELANRAINNGIKHLVFEKVLKHRLQKNNLPDKCEAVSAILGLNKNNFTCLPYKRMPDLLDVLLSDEMKISLPRDGKHENHRRIVKIISEVNPWFTRLLTEYDVVASRPFTAEPEAHCAKRICHVDRAVDPRQAPTYQLDVEASHSKTTELDKTSMSNKETHAEDGSHCSDDVLVPDTRASPNGECPPGNVETFENYDPFPDFDYLQDFDPFQDIELYQNFDPFQDFNSLPDFDLVVPPECSEQNPDTAEKLPPDRIVTTREVPTTFRQDSQANGQEKDGLAFPSSYNILIAQTVC